MSEQAIQTTKRIAVYLRVSTGRQEEEQTIKTQLHAVKDFAAKQGYTIVKEYADDGWSGSMLARPALDELRTDAKDKSWDAVLIYDPDRLARRGFYQELVIDELEQLGIATLFVTMPPVANDEDRLMFNVRGAFAEYERMKITERFRLGKLRKAKEGNVIASEAPYGYKLMTRQGKPGEANFVQTHYGVVEKEADHVRKIFAWVADDSMTLRQVVKRLQDEAIMPRKSKRGVWNTSTLSTLLRNRSYIGEGYYGASYAVVAVNPWKKEGYRRVKKTSRKMRPKAEWIPVKTPSILDAELFNRAQQRLKENFVQARRNRKNEYLLANKMRCVCGCTRAGEGPQKGKHLYYRCTDRVKSYPLPQTCKMGGINARIADEVVWSKVSQLMSSKDLMLAQAKRWVESRKKAALGPVVDVKSLEKEIAKLKTQEDRLTRAYSDEVIDLPRLKELLAPLHEKAGSLQAQIVQASQSQGQQIDDIMPKPEEVEAFAAKAAIALKDLSFEAKRAIVISTVDKVIGTQEGLRVFGFVPVTNYVEYKTSDRHCGAPERRQVDAF